MFFPIQQHFYSEKKSKSKTKDNTKFSHNSILIFYFISGLKISKYSAGINDEKGLLIGSPGFRIRQLLDHCKDKLKSTAEKGGLNGW